MTSTGPGAGVALELNFERRGSGRPLVLLHGWSLSLRSWLPVLDLVAEQREVFAVDLPGFGSSPPLPAGERYTRERLCDALEDFFASRESTTRHCR